jgi:hypothetical protein
MGILTVIALGTALAAGPSNGDFEAGQLDPWVEDSSSGAASVSLQQEGDDFGPTTDTTSLEFPSGTGAAVLFGGPGAQFTAASILSETFVVTNEQVRFRYRNGVADVTNSVRLLVDGSIALSDDVPADTVGLFDAGVLDVSSQCGAEAAIQFVHFSNTSGEQDFFALDDVEVLGPTCADYVDGDGDGFCPHGVDLDSDGTCTAVDEAEPASAPEQDCDDDNADRFPGNPEVVGDGIDQDCDGIDPSDDCFEDLDGDGFGGAQIAGSLACDQPQETNVPGDCDDLDEAVFPGAVEGVADGIDQDCDGFEQCVADADGDGFGNDDGVVVSGSLACDQPGEALTPADCDDGAPTTFPGAPELCNGVDDNCDDVVDPDPPMSAFPDLDGDGFGAAGSTGIEVCEMLTGVADVEGDCDDTAADVNPDADELPDDGVDQDCDGLELCFDDVDNDGFAGDALALGDVFCTGFPDEGGDCDDNRPAVNPLAPEFCDGVDNDCNGLVDDGVAFLDFFIDADQDGFGDPATAVTACTPPGPGFISMGMDCDDANNAINPAATDVPADGVDQDCSGGDTCFVDLDLDTYGGLSTFPGSTLDCSAPGESPTNDDCDDNVASVNPGATEIPGNGRDEDCDGADAAADTGDTGDAEPDPASFVYRGGTSCSVAGVRGSLGLWAGLGLLLFARRRP